MKDVLPSQPFSWITQTQPRQAALRANTERTGGVPHLKMGRWGSSSFLLIPG